MLSNHERRMIEIDHRFELDNTAFNFFFLGMAITTVFILLINCLAKLF